MELYLDTLTQRKALLERALARAEPGLRFNEHLDNEDGPRVSGHLLIPGRLFTARAGDAQRNATADSSIASKLLRMRSPRPPSTLRCLILVLSRRGANLRGPPHPARSALVLVPHGVRR
jgi:hypothetical protein